MKQLNDYINLIELRLHNPYNGKYEKHHIIPKSIQNKQIVLDLFKDYKTNQIVKLSYQEHFKAHCLLVDIAKELLDKQSFLKMSNAWCRMSNSNNYNNTILAEEYAYYRSQWINSIQGKNHPNYGHKWLDEQKEMHRQKNLGENNPFYGKHHNKETIEYLKQINLGENNPMWNKYSRKICIVQLKLDGTLIKEYNFIKDVKNDGFVITKVNNCINHKYITKLGNNIYGKRNEEKYIWMKKDEYLEVNK